MIRVSESVVFVFRGSGVHPEKSSEYLHFVRDSYFTHVFVSQEMLKHLYQQNRRFPLEYYEHGSGLGCFIVHAWVAVLKSEFVQERVLGVVVPLLMLG